jgi:hypothetical protein
MELRHLTSAVATGDTSTYETGSIAASANSLVLAFVTSAVPLISNAPNVPTLTGPQPGWVMEKTITFGDNNSRRLTCFRTMTPTAASGPVSIEFDGQAQDFCAWSIFEYLGVDTSGTFGSGAIEDSGTASGTGPGLTAALKAATIPTTSTSVGAVALEVLGLPPNEVVAGAGFQEITEQPVSQFLQKGAWLQAQSRSPAVTKVDWTWAGNHAAGATVVLVRPAPVVAPPSGPVTPVTPENEALIKRFEPILFFHPDEKFFPVDAKRFVENAALWRSRAPLDDKRSWGGMPADPFPRSPQVAATKLSAKSGEPGEFKFVDALGKENDNRFLELGGWKDGNESPETTVSASSVNAYANRDAIAELYRTRLSDSRFWYHAEVFDNDRLKRLALRDPDQSLTKLVAGRPDWKLLCYYLFFPAHEQTVGDGTCTTLEAREIACHAGDWQCIAILLKGTAGGGAAAYTPKFIGHTGSRPVKVDVGGESVFRPFAFDDDGFTAMKVEAWREGQPQLTEGHPRFYVALGSHSLYTSPGDHDVDPYLEGQEPQKCGILDAPTPTGPAQSYNPFPDVWPLLAKFVGPLLVPFGALIYPPSIVAGVIEFVRASGPFGAAPNETDVPKPDSTPTRPGQGRTLKPTGLNVPDAGADVQDWESQRTLTVGGRTYDCVVNRETQLWWPNDDGKRGFWGRWGQHVTTDSLTRRAGPHFPDYVAMFLTALEYGNGTNQLDLDA